MEFALERRKLEGEVPLVHYVTTSRFPPVKVGEATAVVPKSDGAEKIFHPLVIKLWELKANVKGGDANLSGPPFNTKTRRCSSSHAGKAGFHPGSLTSPWSVIGSDSD